MLLRELCHGGDGGGVSLKQAEPARAGLRSKVTFHLTEHRDDPCCYLDEPIGYCLAADVVLNAVGIESIAIHSSAA